MWLRFCCEPVERPEGPMINWCAQWLMVRTFDSRTALQNYTSTYMQTHVCACVHTCDHTCMHTCMCLYTHLHTHAPCNIQTYSQYTYTSACAYKWMCMHTCNYTYMHPHTHMHTCMPTHATMPKFMQSSLQMPGRHLLFLQYLFI